MDDTWIKLYRKALKNGWLSNHKLWAFWCYCLIKATHKKHRQLIGNQQIMLKPGQFIFGRKKAADELKMSERSVRTCAETLTKLENIAIKTTNKFSVISIVNWDSYQTAENNERPTNRQQTANKPPTNRHKQECKEDKNEKKKDNNHKDEYFFSLLPDELNNSVFIDIWKEWVEFRKEKKKPITEKAAKMQLKILEEHHNPNAVIEYSIMNGYQGLFPENIKVKKNGNSNQRSPQELADQAQQIYNHLENKRRE